MLCVLWIMNCWTYISAKHVVRVAHIESIEPDWCYSVDAVKDKKHLLFGPVEIFYYKKSKVYTGKKGAGYRKVF